MKKKLAPKKLINSPPLLRLLDLPQRKLSQVEKLSLSKWIDPTTNQIPPLKSKAEPPDLFAGFAQNSFEKVAAHFYNQIPPEPLRSCQDFFKAKFLFQCFYVPLFARIEIEKFKENGQPPLWLFESATYLIAMERTQLEMVLSVTSVTSQQINFYNGFKWGKPTSLSHFAELPKPDIEWFLNPPGDMPYWNRRLIEWRNAANKSFRHWVGTWCKDTLELSRKLADAAFAGALFHNSPLPPSPLLDNQIRYIAKSQPGAIRAFLKNFAQPEPSRDRDAEIECWLLEIWPIVVEQKWKYPKISEVAIKKFPRKDRSSLMAGGIEAKCEALQLKLHESQRKGGRTRSMAHTGQGVFELMAVSIDSVGLKNRIWLAGQRG